jgi:lysyl-tRNA synthetase class 1
MGGHFPGTTRSEDGYQRFIFDAARLTPIEQSLAFQAIYRVLLDKDRGPKGGALFSYLDSQFLVRRLSEVTYSIDGFWNESSVTHDDCAAWMARHQSQIEAVSYAVAMNTLVPTEQSPDYGSCLRTKGVVELRVRLANTKEHMLRVLLTDVRAGHIDVAQAAKDLEDHGSAFVNDLSSRLGLSAWHRMGSLVTEEYTEGPICAASGAGTGHAH